MLGENGEIHYTEVAYMFDISPSYAREILKAIANTNSNFRYEKGVLRRVSPTQVGSTGN